MDEKEVTLRDVLGYVAGFVFVVCLIVAVFALVWTAWYTFRVAVTIILIVCIAVAFDWFYQDYINARK